MIKRFLTVTALVILSVMTLTSCNKKDETINPTDINVNGDIISYYSNKGNVEKILGEGQKEEAGSIFTYDIGDDGKLRIIYDEEGNIRWINILDISIKTYNNISCLDDIGKVTEAYKYEKVSDIMIEVLFDGNKEVEWKTPYDIADEQITITYFCQDGKIGGITISDWEFAMKKN